MLEIKNLRKYYGDKQVLKDINLSLPRGEIVGLFGKNGAGKTTLIKCIFNFISYRGDITLDGEEITNKNITNLSFATSEHSFFPSLTADEHRDFYKDHFPAFADDRYQGLMDFFSLPRNKRLKHFSNGQKNQFEVIMALSQGADYIFMDEPFAGNDVFNREDFYKVLAGILNENETLFIATHLIDEVSSFIGRAVLLSDGVITGDKTSEEMDNDGQSLMDYVKTSFRYENNRVSEALDKIRGENQ